MNPEITKLAEIINNLEDARVEKKSDYERLVSVSVSLVRSILAERPELAAEEIEIVRNWLDSASRAEFQIALGDRSSRESAAEVCFDAIRVSDYGLLEMMLHRVAEIPDRTLISDLSAGEEENFSYLRVFEDMKSVAGAFYELREEPRVALFLDNCYDGAVCDLACLSYDVLVTPLNVRFNSDNLKDVFLSLGINIVVTDSPARLNVVREALASAGLEADVLVSEDIEDSDSVFLERYARSLDRGKIEENLRNRRRFKINEVATVMFTSGSSGKPKGVSFSKYHIVTKRFARHAALPTLGFEEKTLSYLPLFHTFGRYFELTGMIYWRGTYVLVGSTSSDALLSLFPKVNPTMFISIPLRWAQLYDKCVADFDKPEFVDSPEQAVRKNAGTALKWGISAAGFLDPRIFKFFENNGVNICSGFGMTEATGGITMTPPGGYVENSNGLPLPGMILKLTDRGELLIGGHYVARYLDEKGPGDLCPFPDEEEGFIATGDVFKVDDNGFYSIVDRIKDIYKNNRGQTVAPQKIEKKFIDVPGVKRAFLVGDGKPYNVIFIVPDEDDEVIKTAETDEAKREYFRKIVEQANFDLAPYERAINFSILDRDFSKELGELTEKGSFNRKIIEKNYEEQIEFLYKKNRVELQCGGMTLKIPRWFYRDLGILEDEITSDGEELVSAANEARLVVRKLENRTLVGDLEYEIQGDEVDLGRFVRRPQLWAGNPSLIAFGPVREGWDSRIENVSDRVFRPLEIARSYSNYDTPESKYIKNHNLLEANKRVVIALFGEESLAIHSVEMLAETLDTAESRLADLIRRRLEALALRDEESIRCLAYKILLLDEPNPDYNINFPAFIESGKTFLNADTIRELASGSLERRRLESLRQRMFSYRTQLSGEKLASARDQFSKVFRLLVDFSSNNPAFYGAVRAELAGWIMHSKDPELAKVAERFFDEHTLRYENRLSDLAVSSQGDPERAIVFDEDLSGEEISALKKVLIGTTFLHQSIILAYDERKFDFADVPRAGIWISKLVSGKRYKRYRTVVNTKDGKNFDLTIVLYDNVETSEVVRALYEIIAIAGYPYYPKVFPQIGCCRPELKAFSMRFNSELSIWEKVREMSGIGKPGEEISESAWRRLFVLAIAAYYRVWLNGGKRAIPELIGPEFVHVPELDYKDGASVSPTMSFVEYESPLSLIRPFMRNFYLKTATFYPRFKSVTHMHWIFDAAYEGLGRAEAANFLDELDDELRMNRVVCLDGLNLNEVFERYKAERGGRYYVPVRIWSAVERYANWAEADPQASPRAKEQSIFELARLYGVNEEPDIARYFLYRKTYFADFDDKTLKTFDKLLDLMSREPDKKALQFLELSDLQSSLAGAEDREVFSRMVFPRAAAAPRRETLKFGEDADKQLVVKSFIEDKFGETYVFRRPLSASEVGRLYRLFYAEKYPKTISEIDEFYVTVDSHDRIIGGICYKIREGSTALIDGTVVSGPLKGRGIGRAMIEEFVSRMAGKGVKIIRTHYLMREFYRKLGFAVDQNRGALVKRVRED